MQLQSKSSETTTNKAQAIVNELPYANTGYANTKVEAHPNYNLSLENNYTGNFLARTINALIDLKDIVPTVEFIQRKLKISKQEIDWALNSLTHLGIIERTGLGLRKILKYIYYPNNAQNIKKSIADHALISTEILNHLQTKEHNQFYRTSIVATDNENVKIFINEMDQALKSFLVRSESGPKNAVYGLSITGSELLNNKFEDL